MFTVYILYSEKYKKKYIGYTSHLIERFKSHNELSVESYTMKFRPWKVLHTEIYDSKAEAMKREKQLKGGQGRQWIDEHLIPFYKNIGFIST